MIGANLISVKITRYQKKADTKMTQRQNNRVPKERVPKRIRKITAARTITPRRNDYHLYYSSVFYAQKVIC